MGTRAGDGQYGFAMLAVDEAAMWELELHTNGGLLVCSGELDLRAGDGVSVTLHLSSGTKICLAAQVSCLRVINEAGKLGAWIEYTGLGAVERREFLRWQQNIKRERGSSCVCVEVERKYRVRRSGDALSVWIGGLLEAGEARALCEVVMSKIEAEERGMLALMLDIGELAPMSGDALRGTRRWLRHLAHTRAPLGVLIGRSSAGYVQMRRVLREVGLDELLVSFDELEAALPSWELLLDQIVGERQSPRWLEESLCA